jgi:hypothetical protein
LENIQKVIQEKEFSQNNTVNIAGQNGSNTGNPSKEAEIFKKTMYEGLSKVIQGV